MKKRFGTVLAATTLSVLAGTVLVSGTAFGDDEDGGNRLHRDSNRHSYNRHIEDSDYDNHEQEGGGGGRGGRNSAECLIPLGLSAGGLASSGGEVNQCNSRGGNGGGGGAGHVRYH